jgi:hypothetical protein
MKETPFALRNEQGQGTLEWFIAFPVVMLLLGGIVQAALVFTTQSTLNWATFYGVREATINHGSVQALRTGLAKGLMPLYPGGKNPGAAQTATAYKAAVAAVDNPNQTDIQILNPTPGVIKAWTTTVNKDGQSVSEVPNSRLIYTANTTKAGETLQTANLYKTRIRFCYPLMVPIVNTAVKTLMTGLFKPASAWDAACYGSGGMPMAATATELMQSALYPPELANTAPANPTPPGGTPTPPSNPPGGGTTGCGG